MQLGSISAPCSHVMQSVLPHFCPSHKFVVGNMFLSVVPVLSTTLTLNPRTEDSLSVSSLSLLASSPSLVYSTKSTVLYSSSSSCVLLPLVALFPPLLLPVPGSTCFLLFFLYHPVLSKSFPTYLVLLLSSAVLLNPFPALILFLFLPI